MIFLVLISFYFSCLKRLINTCKVVVWKVPNLFQGKSIMFGSLGMVIASFFFYSLKDPSINIAELKDIHSEINLTVPDPILVPHLHDGLETVRTNIKGNLNVFML